MSDPWNRQINADGDTVADGVLFALEETHNERFGAVIAYLDLIAEMLANDGGTYGEFQSRLWRIRDGQFGIPAPSPDDATRGEGRQ